MSLKPIDSLVAFRLFEEWRRQSQQLEEDMIIYFMRETGQYK
ncbi:MAG TPA: hypothetical protein VI933_00720 [archaeon]|nr:hypothetical protein [archaeon]